MCKAIKASGNTAGKAWSLCVTIHLPGRCTSGTEFIKQSQSTGFHTSTCQRPSLDDPQTIVSALQSSETSCSKGWTRSELRPSKQHARHFAPIHSPEESGFLLCLKPTGEPLKVLSIILIRFLLFSGEIMLSWNKSYCWDGNKSLCSQVLLAAFLFPLFVCISLPFSWMVMFLLNLLSIQSRTRLNVFLTPATYS